MLNLHTSNPEIYIDDNTPRDLVDAAEKLSAWDQEAGATVDYLLNAWVLRACMNDDPEGTTDLNVAIRTLLDRLPISGSVPEAWRHRWQAYQELLGARTLRFTTQREIDALLGRQHIKDLLLLLPRDGDFRAQPELHLAGETGRQRFSDSRLSQLLGQIEDHGLIAHRKRGRNKDWRLTESGRQVAAQLAPAAKTSRGGLGFAFGNPDIYRCPPERLADLAEAA